MSTTPAGPDGPAPTAPSSAAPSSQPVIPTTPSATTPSPTTSSPTTPSAAGPSASSDPDAPSGWGPTVGEIARARDLAAGLSDERLAGQVIVGRYLGTDPEEAAALVREDHLAGLSITSDNVTDETQLRALTAAVSKAALADDRPLPAIIGVDQEGGTVEQLRGIATEFPPFADAGLAIAADPGTGPAIVAEAAAASALELRDLGFTWVFGPVADVTIGPGDPTIGSRSPSTDPRLAAKAVSAALGGYAAAGVVTTVKHFPGHGSVTSDSHLTTPLQPAPLAQVRAHDLPPFVAAVADGAPAVMMSHIDLRSLEPGVPASLSPEAYHLLRDDLDFQGVAITDSLGMGAVVGRETPALQALAAGADLLLMPADTEATHATLTAALASGAISRARVEEAASRVIALQLWQERTTAGVPVPDDATTRAEDAAAALVAAAQG